MKPIIPACNPLRKCVLSERHRRQLEDESGIAREIYEERGVRTITHGRQLPKGFARRQRRLGSGLLFTGHAPDGTEFYIFRPDRPDPKKPGRKYEMQAKACGGPGNRLDIHPSCRHLISRTDVPVIFVEGIKKADAILSASRAAEVEVLVVAIMGTWNWKSDGEPISDMFEIPVKGRRVTVLFDSDVLRNPGVQDAARRLATHHGDRGADVYMTFLPDQADGSKMGADDYLLEHTLRELQLLMRPYDPTDFTLVRLSRDERLRLAIRDLRSRWWGFGWSQVVGTSESERPNSMRGHSCRDLAKVGIDEAARSGEVVVDGVRFTLSTRIWSLRTATSRQTTMKGIAHLEAEGWLRRDYGDKAADAPGSYVLLTACSSLDHDGKKQGQEGEATQGLQAFDPGGQGLSTPRLRWSAPTFDREGDRLVRGYVRRLGKHRGAIIDVLVKEGPMDITEVAEALQASRVSNLRRSLLRLQEAEIVAVDGDKVSLSPNWAAALEEERKLKGEIRNDAGEDGAEERDRGRYRLQSEAYREWLRLSPEERKALKEQRARACADGFIGDLRPADEPEEQQREREISPLATAIRTYLEGNPHDASQPPGWLGTTLWAFDLYPDKPTPAQARAAVDELGGEAYLRHTLEQAKGAA